MNIEITPAISANFGGAVYICRGNVASGVDSDGPVSKAKAVSLFSKMKLSDIAFKPTTATDKPIKARSRIP